jgi:hypothetical protein
MAINVLSNHKFDVGYNQNQRMTNNGNKSSKQAPSLLFARLQGKRYCSGAPDSIWHLAQEY